jgi:hypothetical protein
MDLLALARVEAREMGSAVWKAQATATMKVAATAGSTG